ncbi:MAG: hypothetical protein ACI7YS_11255 [Flavobacterium sp.]
MDEKINRLNKLEDYLFDAHIGQKISEMSILIEYKRAINILIENLQETKTSVDTIDFPLLYMMRHSLELGFKFNIRFLAKYNDKELKDRLLYCHNLEILLNEFKELIMLINPKFDNDLKSQISKYLDSTSKLVLELGPTEASAFRYLEHKNVHIFGSKEKRNVREIKELYDEALIMLVNTFDVISDLELN